MTLTALHRDLDELITFSLIDAYYILKKLKEFLLGYGYVYEQLDPERLLCRHCKKSE